MSILTYERLHANLEKLKLTRISEILDNYLERALKDNISLIDALDYLVEEEKIHKDERYHLIFFIFYFQML